jgi:hypothetical protein
MEGIPMSRGYCSLRKRALTLHFPRKRQFGAVGILRRYGYFYEVWSVSRGNGGVFKSIECYGSREKVEGIR